MEIRGKTAVVTGGSRGIGHGLVKILSSGGATVFSLSRDQPEEPVQGVEYLNADITDAGQVDLAFQQVSAAAPIDFLVNNAGTLVRKDLYATSAEEFDRVFDTNLRGSWLVTKHARPYLEVDATIAFISSDLVMRKGQTNPGVYILSKIALDALASMTQAELPDCKVKVALIGPVATDLLRSGRTPADIERIIKIADSPEFAAGKLMELLTSEDKHRLVYAPGLGYVLG
jgi:3-oxoacyl-[acyl-carrier protein] reductase